MKSHLLLLALVCPAAFAGDLKTYGRTDTQELVSVATDDEGQPDPTSLRPPNAPADWQPPTLIPLVKLPAPDFDPETQRAEPVLVWHADRVERQWTVGAYTPPVPVSVTKRQLRLELLSRGLLDQVVPAIQAALEGPAETAALIEWEDAVIFERSHPLVAQIGAILNQTPAQMDAIWRAADRR